MTRLKLFLLALHFGGSLFLLALHFGGSLFFFFFFFFKVFKFFSWSLNGKYLQCKPVQNTHIFFFFFSLFWKCHKYEIWLYSWILFWKYQTMWIIQSPTSSLFHAPGVVPKAKFEFTQHLLIIPPVSSFIQLYLYYGSARNKYLP